MFDTKKVYLEFFISVNVDVSICVTLEIAKWGWICTNKLSFRIWTENNKNTKKDFMYIIENLVKISVREEKNISYIYLVVKQNFI